MPLKVVVIGAGIAGLAAATTLCQAGHSVQVVEKSEFKTEVGAALILMPNGSYVLEKLGFDFERALVGRHHQLETLNGINLQPLTSVDMTNSEEIYGGRMQSVLRADLHSELLRLSQQGPNPAVLRLGSKVKYVDPVEGVVETESGQIYTADLIIAADGSHSVCREAVLGHKQEPQFSGKSAFRFLLRTQDIKDLEVIKELLPGEAPGATIFADVQDKHHTRHLAWYACHGGLLQNFVGIYPAEQHVEGADNKLALIEQFEHFHPSILGLLRLADDVRVWPLRFDEPFERYSRGKVVLVGDAAHTMLPFSGQGANQAIEGAGMLGNFFAGAEPKDVPDRLQQYCEIRQSRIDIIKLLSRIRFGRENNHAYNAIKHPGLNSSEVPRSFDDRIRFEWGYRTDDEYRRYQNAHIDQGTAGH